MDGEDVEAWGSDGRARAVHFHVHADWREYERSGECQEGEPGAAGDGAVVGAENQAVFCGASPVAAVARGDVFTGAVFVRDLHEEKPGETGDKRGEGAEVPAGTKNDLTQMQKS